MLLFLLSVSTPACQHDGLMVSSSKSGDAATKPDGPPLPPDVTIVLLKDLAKADARCIAGTAGWLDLVASMIPTYRVCQTDADCEYVTFYETCGVICQLPMKGDWSGGFAYQTGKYADANCASCPTGLSLPDCPASSTVYCNAGRCELS